MRGRHFLASLTYDKRARGIVWRCACGGFGIVWDVEVDEVGDVARYHLRAHIRRVGAPATRAFDLEVDGVY